MTRIDEIRERWKKATPGPWRADEDDYTVWGPGECEPVLQCSCWERRGDVEAIAAAPEDIAYLLARVEELEVALRGACDLAEEGWSYASDYFRDKWDSVGRLVAIREALKGDAK